MALAGFKDSRIGRMDAVFRHATESIRVCDQEQMMASLTHQAVEEKAERAHRAVDETAARAIDRAAPTIDRVAQAAHRTVDRVAEAAGPAAEWIAHNASELRSRQAELIDVCRVRVRERPMTAIGIALVAGYALARLVR
jgi:hypothetical protein